MRNGWATKDHAYMRKLRLGIHFESSDTFYVEAAHVGDKTSPLSEYHASPYIR